MPVLLMGIVLAVALAVGSGFVLQRYASVPADQILEARRLAQVDDSDRLTVAVARHLAFRTAVGMVVDGSVTPIGGKGYSLVARLVDVNDGRVIASASGFADEGDIAVVVDPRQFLAGRRPRVEDGTPALAEFGGNHLHHLMTRYPLGVSRWSKVIREARGSKNGQRQQLTVPSSPL